MKRLVWFLIIMALIWFLAIKLIFEVRRHGLDQIEKIYKK
jgi:hypothetical protein